MRPFPTGFRCIAPCLMLLLCGCEGTKAVRLEATIGNNLQTSVLIQYVENKDTSKDGVISKCEGLNSKFEKIVNLKAIALTAEDSKHCRYDVSLEYENIDTFARQVNENQIFGIDGLKSLSARKEVLPGNGANYYLAIGMDEGTWDAPLLADCNSDRKSCLEFNFILPSVISDHQIKMISDEKSSPRAAKTIVTKTGNVLSLKLVADEASAVHKFVFGNNKLSEQGRKESMMKFEKSIQNACPPEVSEKKFEIDPANVCHQKVILDLTGFNIKLPTMTYIFAASKACTNRFFPC